MSVTISIKKVAFEDTETADVNSGELICIVRLKGLKGLRRWKDVHSAVKRNPGGDLACLCIICLLFACLCSSLCVCVRAPNLCLYLYPWNKNIKVLYKDACLAQDGCADEIFFCNLILFPSGWVCIHDDSSERRDRRLNLWSSLCCHVVRRCLLSGHEFTGLWSCCMDWKSLRLKKIKWKPLLRGNVCSQQVSSAKTTSSERPSMSSFISCCTVHDAQESIMKSSIFHDQINNQSRGGRLSAGYYTFPFLAGL